MRTLFFISSILLFTLVVVRVVLSFFLGPAISDGQQLAFTATILSEPQEKFGHLTFPVTYSNGWGDRRISISTASEDLHYGQKIHIAGSIKTKVLDNENLVYSMS